MIEPIITVHDSADPADVKFIHSGLREYNAQFAPLSHRPLYVFLRDEAGALVGGLLGDIYWGWLHVGVLWIDERYRRQGIGERMLAAAEAEARACGCRYVHLDTLSFQARPFYEKLGYRLFGQLEDFPAGTAHTRYFLFKPL